MSARSVRLASLNPSYNSASMTAALAPAVSAVSASRGNTCSSERLQLRRPPVQLAPTYAAWADIPEDEHGEGPQPDDDDA